jgi:hypothetical protein
MVTETWFAPRAGAYAVHSANETGPGMRVAQPVNDVVPGSMPFKRLGRRQRLIDGVKDLAKDVPNAQDRAQLMAYAQWYVTSALDNNYLDTGTSAGNAAIKASEPYLLYLDEIVSGLGVNGRTSNSITFRRLRCLLSGSIVPYSADVTKPLPPTTIKARIVVFQWLPNTTPGKADILTLPGGSSYVYAFYNHANREQYRVMFDRTYVLSHGPIATAYNGLSTTPPSFGMGPNSQFIDWVELANWKQDRRRFDSSSVQTGSGRLWALLVHDGATATNTMPNVTNPVVDFSNTFFRLHYSN